jgi:phytoene dehydrogenase-like protein
VAIPALAAHFWAVHAPGELERDDFRFVHNLLEHFEQYPEIVRHHEAGTIPPTVMWGACPTQFDPSQAPAGKHTAFMWEKAMPHNGTR